MYAHLMHISNIGEKCKTRLVHDFRSTKVMASLNESLKSALQTLRQIARLAPQFLSSTVRSSYVAKWP